MKQLLRLAVAVGAALAGMGIGTVSLIARQDKGPQEDPLFPKFEPFQITGLRKMAGGYTSPAELKAIAAQENLERLDISGADLRQSDYEWLADLRALRVLTLHNTGIRDSGLARLAGLKELEELDLSQTGITQKSLALLGTFSRLRILTLDLESCLKDAKELAHLTALKELRTLTLTITGTDEEMRFLSTIGGLEELNLETKAITAQGLNQLSALSQMRRLSVRVYHDQKNLQMDPALQLPRLEFLELRYVPVGDAWAEGLRGCPNLYSLQVHSPGRLTDAGVARIAAFTKLQELSLTGVDGMTDRGVALLADLKELHSLNLNYCPAISDQAIAHLIKLPRLRKLEIACPKLGDQGIRQLTVMHELQYLDICNTAATDACISDLAKLSHLKELWIIRSKITRDGYHRLEKLLPDCAVIMKTGSLVISGSGWAADREEPEPAKSGTVVGTLVAKGRGWIEVKEDGQTGPRAYAPLWTRADRDYRGRWDDDTMQAIEKLSVGNRIRVEWKYDLRPRVIKMEAIKQ